MSDDIAHPLKVVGVEATADAAYTYVYRPNTRWSCSGCTGIGRDRNNYENRMRVSDCGGVFNNNCNHTVWEQNTWGRATTRPTAAATTFGSAATTRSATPVGPSASRTMARQATLGYCDQGYGF